MFTLFSGILGAAFGFLKYIVSTHMEFRHMQQMAMMEKAKLISSDRKRAASITDKGVAFTRRILAIILVSALVAPVFYGIFYPNATITVPQEMLDKSFWDILLPWREGQKVTQYVTIRAPVLAMPIVDLCAMILGFYFGSGGSRR